MRTRAAASTASRTAAPAEAVAALAHDALARGRQALAHNDHAEALRWLDRAHRLVPHDPNAALTLASVCLVSDAA
ncbi:MAG TPA: hypothetical protein VE690_04940, partial [Rhodopila sp.]|nr:hypothetical protein [Rhodopila sp.]